MNFNPRTIQDNLLKWVLDDFGNDIKIDNIPMEMLEQFFGGSKKMILLTRQKRKNESQYHRWLPFLEIYDGSGSIKNLDTDLRNVFNILEIPDAETDEIVGDKDKKKGKKIIPPLNLTQIVSNRRMLGNGDVLGQSVSGMLKTYIFFNYGVIDWDIEGFEKTAFVNTSSEENRC